MQSIWGQRHVLAPSYFHHILLSLCPSLLLNKHFDFIIGCWLICFGSKDCPYLCPSQEWQKLENSEKKGAGSSQKKTQRRSLIWKRKGIWVYGRQPARFSAGLAVAFADNGAVGGIRWEPNSGKHEDMISQRLFASVSAQVKGGKSALEPSYFFQLWVLLADTWGGVWTDLMWILWLIFRGKGHGEN